MRKTKLIANHFYHLYNRGVNRGKIFFQPKNWQFFLERWRTYCPPEAADVIAYCLMPNHYHYLIQPKIDDFGLGVMQPFTVSYTKAINKQEGRVGALFQGPFQAKEIISDSHLVQLSRYIHLNPVVAGYVKNPADWTYSSYQDYVALRNGSMPQMDIIWQSFKNPQEYKEFVEGPEARDYKALAHLIMD